jgi:hypothetical protein
VTGSTMIEAGRFPAGGFTILQVSAMSSGDGYVRDYLPSC